MRYRLLTFWFHTRYFLVVLPVALIMAMVQMVLIWLSIFTPSSLGRRHILFWSMVLDQEQQDWRYRQWRQLYDREHLFDILRRDPEG